ncbi:hypothetical protein LR48_Vigan07g229400 [Vigna angularis]|uniref:Uncharacterized protein n=1 Tax=Phaseolus angularis TaxID=3914 RepID=A0A0L9V0F5_PHAAN|nr:hypothetical protein LR48_Vigan07g229400 [Vigna angularis]
MEAYNALLPQAKVELSEDWGKDGALPRRKDGALWCEGDREIGEVAVVRCEGEKEIGGNIAGCAKEREGSRGGSVVTGKSGPMDGVLKIGGVAAASWFSGGSVVVALDIGVILENVVGEEDFVWWFVVVRNRGISSNSYFKPNLSFASSSSSTYAFFLFVSTTTTTTATPWLATPPPLCCLVSPASFLSLFAEGPARCHFWMRLLRSPSRHWCPPLLPPPLLPPSVLPPKLFQSCYLH